MKIDSKSWTKILHILVRNLHMLEMITFQKFLESSITYVDDCQFIHIDVPEREMILGEIEESEINEIVDLFCVRFDMTKASFDHTFKIRGVNGPFISLQRLRKSYCPICERTHHAENPFLFVAGDGLFYSCRRASGNIFISEYIKEEEVVEDKVVEEVMDKIVEKRVIDKKSAIDELMMFWYVYVLKNVPK